MKLEVGKKYKTKSGREVEIVGKYADNQVRSYPYIGLNRDASGQVSWVDNYNETGISGGGSSSQDDIVPQTIKHTRWVVSFRHKGAPRTDVRTATYKDMPKEFSPCVDILNVQEIYFVEIVE